MIAMAGATPPPNADARAQDWRNGAIVYQVFVDRFAPPASLASKSDLIKSPRRLMAWGSLPHAGVFRPELGVWSHELDFWGGDLMSLRGKLSYIEDLGADVLYLTPIHKALTNHRYDAQDYMTIAPEVGTRHQLVTLIQTVHQRGMKIMLDGVFNHMGKTSERFQSALHSPRSPYRTWFRIGKQYPGGYQAWAGAGNLVTLRLENPAVRDYLWNNPDSVVKSYLADGIDGWRLDVAFELGPKYLSELTHAAHAAKPGSAVVGEISGYPGDWFPAVDGVFNFFPMRMALEMTSGHVPGGRAGVMLQHMVDDAGLDNLLKSWLLLDNHDTPRIANQIPDIRNRRIAQVLQLTLPGSPVIYYGSELGMEGQGDPENRAPMRWDLVKPGNADLAWIRKLIVLRKRHPALKYGDFMALDTSALLGFTRTTGQIRDAVVVLINPTETEVTETFPVRIGRIMSWGAVTDLLSGEQFRIINGIMTTTVPARGIRILTPVTAPNHGYSPYTRIP